MANVAAYAQKAVLDWLMNGATPTRPAQTWVGLAIGTPTSVTGSEVQPNSGYARQTGLFGAAASPAGSASNTAAMTFGPFSSVQSVQGVIIAETASINSGSMLWYGTLSVARTVQPGDQIVFVPGALICTLA